MENQTKFKPVLVGVYGTLRKNCGNHYGRLDQPGVKFIDTIKTEPKFTMYAKNMGFPIVKRGGKTSLTLEVYEVSNPAVMHSLNNLEGCTGVTDHPNNWYNIVPVQTPLGDVMIYVQDDYNGPEANISKTGDWLNK